MKPALLPGSGADAPDSPEKRAWQAETNAETNADAQPGTGEVAWPRQTERRERPSGVRRATAEAVTRSAAAIPHVTEFTTIDATATVELVARLKAHPAFAGSRVSPLLIAVRALTAALARTPALASRWDDATGELVSGDRIDVGIAAATPRGLVVPKVRDAGRRTLADLAAELTAVTDRARAGRSAPAELVGGTVTITNLGSFGIDAGTPIITPGESAILCLGAIRPRAWEHEGGVALRHVLTLSLSFDHRVADGAEGSALLADVAAMLADPVELLASS